VNTAVIAPSAADLPALPPDVDVVRYERVDAVLEALRGRRRVVLLSDALGADVWATVAAAVHDIGVEVIEVHSRRWDGETHSPLTAASRGVIAGFGSAAVLQALAVLGPAGE
jgi:hypothetical protein